MGKTGWFSGLLQKNEGDDAPKDTADDTDVEAILNAEGSVPLDKPKGGGGRPGSSPSKPGLKPLQPTMQTQAPQPQAPMTGNVGSDTPRSFPEIYAASKIQVPPHGYTSDKVIELLNSPRLQALPEGAKAASALAILDFASVPLQDILQDAVARAAALEAYEGWQVRKFAEADEKAEAEAQRLEAELAQVTAQVQSQIRASRQGPTMRAEALASWRLRRDEELRRLHLAASLAVPPGEDNPVQAPISQVQGFGAGSGPFNPFQPPNR